MKRAVTAVTALLCFAIFISAQPNKAPKNKSQSPCPKEPITLQIEHQEIARDAKNQADSRPPQWYASPEWWLFAAAVGTLAAIIYQARESAEATRAMRRSIALQEIGLRQWISFDEWRIVAKEYISYTLSRTQSTVDRKPESIVINITFDIVNGSPRPLTTQGVNANVHVAGRTDWTNIVSEERTLVAPNGTHPVILPIALTGDEVDRYILNKLEVSISGRAFYEDGLSIQNEQTFAKVAQCGVSGSKFLKYLGKGPTKKEQDEKEQDE